MELETLLKALNEHGDQAKTAKALGLSKQRINQLIDDHKIKIKKKIIELNKNYPVNVKWFKTIKEYYI